MTTETRQTYIPKTVTVQIDSRERYPVLFPANVRVSDPHRPGRKQLIKVKTETLKLDTGDYRLKEYPECCVIERKGAQRELFKNLFNTRDQIRTAKALRRLSGMSYPYLLLEVSPASLLSTRTAPSGLRPESLCERLSAVIAKYGLNTLWTGKSNSASARRDLGTVLIHLMLGYALKSLLEVPFDGVVPDMGSSQSIDSAPI
jgi:hypothetical protein